MPEIPPSLAEFASRELRARGIELRTGTRLERMDERSAMLSTGEAGAHAHGLLDGRREAARDREGSSGSRSPSAAASTWTPPCA